MRIWYPTLDVQTVQTIQFFSLLFFLVSIKPSSLVLSLSFCSCRQILMVLTLVDLGTKTSLRLKVEFQVSRDNSNGQWGALHDPLLDQATAELHNPRVIH